MKQVIAADLQLNPITPTNRLPNTCDKWQATQLGAQRINFADHEEMLEETNCRDRLDLDESDEEESTGGGESEDSSDESSIDDEDGRRIP